ncbi:hypothetical protein CEXT_29431 [Caerostris extrusa]|uniref:Uncharacterized protein n=1 Tax=Caerostris extrusa TaxID=172846 RepID=A0AAV4XXU6_CAEEX|nr:hypothetical protein CEXT_29431 [Caerostris extrusa]
MIRKPKLKSNKIPPEQNSRDILQNLPVVYSHATKANPAYVKVHLKRYERGVPFVLFREVSLTPETENKLS